MPRPVGFSSRARWSPLGFLARICSADGGAGPDLDRSCRDIAVAHDGDGDLIPGNDRLVRHPLVLALGIERPETAAVGHYGPCTLRCLAARFPAENDLARHPGIGLDMADLKADRDDIFDRAGVDIHRGDARSAARPYCAGQSFFRS